MWIADQWQDYQVLDTSDGEKLERWGQYILVRPNPQVIWNTPKRSRGWKNYDARYARSNTGGGQWLNRNLPERWQIGYGELNFNLKPMNFKHTGVFPGAGGQLGLYYGTDPQCRTADPGAEPVCLYWRRDVGRGGGRRVGLPCGCGQGNGRLGKGKRKGFRSGGVGPFARL